MQKIIAPKVNKYVTLKNKKYYNCFNQGAIELEKQ